MHEDRYRLDGNISPFVVGELDDIVIEAGRVTGLEVLLLDGLVISGWVEDHRGNRLEGATIKACFPSGSGGVRMSYAESSAEGHFTMECVHPGVSGLEVKLANYRTSKLPRGALEGADLSHIRVVMRECEEGRQP